MRSIPDGAQRARSTGCRPAPRRTRRRSRAARTGSPSSSTASARPATSRSSSASRSSVEFTLRSAGGHAARPRAAVRRAGHRRQHGRPARVPAKLALPPGEHTVKVTNHGLHAVRDHGTIVANQDTQVDAQLHRARPASRSPTAPEGAAGRLPVRRRGRRRRARRRRDCSCVELGVRVTQYDVGVRDRRDRRGHRASICSCAGR